MIAPIEPPFIQGQLPQWFVDVVARQVGGSHRVEAWMRERLTRGASGDEFNGAGLMLPGDFGTLLTLSGEQLGYRTPWTTSVWDFSSLWNHMIWPLAGWDGCGCGTRWFAHQLVAVGEKLPPNFVLDGRVILPETVLHADMSQKLRRDGKLLIFQVEFSLHVDFIDPARFWNRTAAFEDQLQAFVMSQESSWDSRRGRCEDRPSQRAFDFGAAFNRKGPYA